MQGHLEELKRGGRPMTKTEIKLNNLNKGIDELIKKYEEEKEYYIKDDLYHWDLKIATLEIVIQDLKEKLKGE